MEVKQNYFCRISIFCFVIYPNVHFIIRNNLQCVGGQIVNSLDESYHVCQTIRNGVITILVFLCFKKVCPLAFILKETI